MHYSGAEPFTKYEMCLVFAGLLGLEHNHIIPDAEAPKGEMFDFYPYPHSTFNA